MRTKGMRLVGALGVLLGVSLPAAAGGQTGPRDVLARAGTGPALEGFYTRVDFAGAPTAGRRVRAAGLGGRMMWPLAASPDAGSWLARHAAVGVFGAYAREPGRTFSAGQLGVAADLTPLAAPLAGRVEPFVSIGAGALRTSALAAGPVVRPSPRPLALGAAGARATAFAPRDQSATRFMVAPSVGARVQVRPGVAVQGDVRNLTAFRGAAREHYLAVGAGVRVSF